MDIKIRSKDIYDLDNNKLRDNEITGVDYEENDCGFVTDYRVIVQSKSITNIPLDTTDKNSNSKDFKEGSTLMPGTFVDATATANIEVSYTRGTLTIPKKNKNDTIINIYDKIDSNGYSNIRFSIEGTKTINGKSTSFSGQIPIDNTNTNEYTCIASAKNMTGVVVGNVSASVTDKSNLKTLDVREDNENFYIDYKVPYKIKKVASVYYREGGSGGGVIN